MFGFGKSKAKLRADAAIAILDEAIEQAAEKWVFFAKTLVFREDTPLADRIAMFSVPFNEGARNNYPELKDAPDSLLLVILAKGIERSKTHTRAQIEQALGVALPD